MQVCTHEFEVATEGRDAVHDLTPEVARLVTDSGLRDGTATVFCGHSTCGVTTVEHEPGLVHDLKEALARLFPADLRYRHNELNQDDNGHSHVRAAFVGPSLTVPFANRSLTLGTWQQVVLVDFDTHARRRRVVVQLIGTKGA
jgi:secondary thiamine-phosphate synthase enzyme